MIPAALAVTGALSACGLVPTEIGMGPGARTWVIPVTNDSSDPAALFVALDQSPMGEIVGQVTPQMVPPGETVEVTFIVPAGNAWAIFVNPSEPRGGPLVLAADVPADASGALPLQINVDSTGAVSVGAPARPGWFGN